MQRHGRLDFPALAQLVLAERGSRAGLRPTMRASARRSIFARARRNMRSRSASRRSGSPESVGPLAAAHAQALDPVLEEEAVERRLVLQVDVLLAAPRAVERRLRDVEIPVLDELGHLPVEEREKQRADVAAVDVGVGHQDDLVVAELLDVEAAPSPMPQPSAAMSVPISARREHLVEARALDVQDLPLERQDRLELPVAPLLGRAAGAVSLDDVELGVGRVARLAVGELAREASCSRAAPLRTTSRALRAASRAFAARIGLLDDLPRGLRVLLEELPELVVRRRSRRSPSPRSRRACSSSASRTDGSGCLTLMTAVSPSRMSSPVRPFFTSLKRFCAVP